MFDNFEIYAELGSNSEGFDKYTNIGNLLRNRRLDMNLSVDTMAKALKLASRYIQMVEDGNYKDVSQKIYYFGYVRNIARYLKLDEELVLRYLVSEVKTENETLEENKDRAGDINILTKSLMANVNNKNNKTHYKNLIAYLSVVLFLCVVGFIIKEQSEMRDNSSSLMLHQQKSRSQ